MAEGEYFVEVISTQVIADWIASDLDSLSQLEVVGVGGYNEGVVEGDGVQLIDQAILGVDIGLNLVINLKGVGSSLL